MNDQQSFEFLDIITILSFAMQLSNNAALAKQATNNDLLEELHKDVDVLNSKLDMILSVLSSNAGLSYLSVDEDNSTSVASRPCSAR